MIASKKTKSSGITGKIVSVILKTVAASAFGILSVICYARETIHQTLEECYATEEASAKIACYDSVSRQLGIVDRGEDSSIESEEAGRSGREEAIDPVAETAKVKTTVSALEQRFDFEKQASANQFIIIPHLPNYILLYSYNDNINDSPSSPSREPQASSFDQKHSEAKFQISFKVQLGRNFVPEPLSLWFAYTQLSFWQVYNKALSAPFRESNYEPELLLHYSKNFNLFGYSSDHILFGFNHQSNGRAEPLSRSWNRVYLQWIFSRKNLTLSVKPWWRIPEASDEDDNPDIHNFVGYAMFGSTYKSQNKVYDLRLFNNFRSDNNRTSVQLSYSFPLGGRLKGYVQYFNGYGESLLDYNHRVRRLGIGVLLTDWY